jgi:ABC-type multidrug transport system fused ATPase/permease subunit
MNILNVTIKLFSYIKQLNRPLKIRLNFAFLVLIIGISAGTFSPIILRHIINSLNMNDSLLYGIVFLAIAYGISWTINQVAVPVVWLLSQQPADRIASMICERVFSHIQKLSPMFFITEDSRKPITAIERTFQTIPNVFSSLIIYCLPSASEIIIAFCIFTYLYGIIYGLLLFSLVAAFILSSIYITIKVKSTDKKYHDNLDQLNHHISEAIFNHETIMLFACEEYENKKLHNFLENFEKISAKRALLLDGIQAIQTCICGLILAIFTGLSGYSVYQGTLQAGDFVLINSYLMQFMTPLTYLGYVYSSIYRGLSNLSQTFELENLPVTSYPDAKHIEVKDTTIEFNDVSFEQPNRKGILKKISFKLPAQKKIALVGDSGSGKSTCIKLLLRLFEPSSGEITLGGVSLKDIHPESLRKQIGMVPQEPTLFQGTLLENIAYGKLDATEDEIMNVIKKVHLDTLVERLPEGIYTSLSENAIQISGGEKQRLALARAILKDPKIFIFDEATSALDVHTEQEIFKNIEQITKDKSALFITHRLSMALLADIIVVIRQGEIIEQGSHKELMSKNGVYSKLWKEQCKI